MAAMANVECRMSNSDGSFNRAKRSKEVGMPFLSYLLTPAAACQWQNCHILLILAFCLVQTLSVRQLL
jgi:hypothetical protein